MSSAKWNRRRAKKRDRRWERPWAKSGLRLCKYPAVRFEAGELAEDSIAPLVDLPPTPKWMEEIIASQPPAPRTRDGVK